MEEILELLARAPFFEHFEEHYLKKLALLGKPAVCHQGQMLLSENEVAKEFFVLVRGKIKLFYPTPRDDGSIEQVPLRVIDESGRVLGWSALVKPYHYRASAEVISTSELIVFSRSDLEQLFEEEPRFGVEVMRRILWIVGNRLRATRVRLIARRYDEEVMAIRALLDQAAEQLHVTSPLHKIPLYLENRLTISDAFDVLQLLRVHGDETERNVAELCLEILEAVHRELRVFEHLQNIYEHVANAPSSRTKQEIRDDCSREFIKLFEETGYILRGEENLPDSSGNIFLMNHLMNHPDNMLPNEFQLNLDTHFVSSVVVYRKYGASPIRIVRGSYADEYGHKKYYDRLGYLYVYSKPEGETGRITSRARRETREYFISAAAQLLQDGNNLVICPEGRVGLTEESPQRFRGGAFRLAARVVPEPLIVPVAIANFDKKVTRIKPTVLIEKPFYLSSRIKLPCDDGALFEFVNLFQREFCEYVAAAKKLAAEV